MDDLRVKKKLIHLQIDTHNNHINNTKNLSKND